MVFFAFRRLALHLLKTAYVRVMVSYLPNQLGRSTFPIEHLHHTERGREREREDYGIRVSIQKKGEIWKKQKAASGVACGNIRFVAR